MSNGPVPTPQCVRDREGSIRCYFVECMSTRCIHCGNIIRPGQPFIALGAPYMGVVHRGCAPYFRYTGDWPHDLPYHEYREEHPHAISAPDVSSTWGA